MACCQDDSQWQRSVVDRSLTTSAAGSQRRLAALLPWAVGDRCFPSHHGHHLHNIPLLGPQPMAALCDSLQGYAPITDDREDFYNRRMYRRIWVGGRQAACLASSYSNWQAADFLNGNIVQF